MIPVAPIPDVGRSPIGSLFGLFFFFANHCMKMTDFKTWKNGKAFSSQGKVREF